MVKKNTNFNETIKKKEKKKKKLGGGGGMFVNMSAVCVFESCFRTQAVSHSCFRFYSRPVRP